VVLISPRPARHPRASSSESAVLRAGSRASAASGRGEQSPAKSHVIPHEVKRRPAGNLNAPAVTETKLGRRASALSVNLKSLSRAGVARERARFRRRHPRVRRVTTVAPSVATESLSCQRIAVHNETSLRQLGESLFRVIKIAGEPCDGTLSDPPVDGPGRE
jgi:hypothetical protein